MVSLDSISFGNTLVKYNELFSKNNSKKIMTDHPKINIKNNNYTIIMVDPDAPAGLFLHWLVINGTTTIVDYMPPNPPSGLHKYHILIYDQLDKIPPLQINQRTNFNLKRFVDKHKLLLKYKFNFQVKV